MEGQLVCLVPSGGLLVSSNDKSSLTNPGACDQDVSQGPLSWMGPIGLVSLEDSKSGRSTLPSELAKRDSGGPLTLSEDGTSLVKFLVDPMDSQVAPMILPG